MGKKKSHRYERQQQKNTTAAGNVTIGTKVQESTVGREELAKTTGQKGQDNSLGRPFTDWLFGVSWVVYLIVGVVFIVAKVIWENVHQGRTQIDPVGHAIVSVLYEIGIALLVFAFVSITVERFARAQIVREFETLIEKSTLKHEADVGEIKLNVFQHLFGRVIGEDVVKHLMETVFAQNWFRRNLRIEYNFRPCSGDAEHLILKADVSYVLHNLFNQPKEYEFLQYYENFIEHRHSGNLIFFEIRDDKKPIVRLTKTDLNKNNPPVFREGIRHGLQLVQTVSCDRPLKVQFVYETIRRRCDCEIFVTSIPADGIEVRVNDPSDSTDFYPDSAHTLEPVPDSIPPDGTPTHWHIQCPLLPGQGFVLYWKPRAATNAMQQVTADAS